MNNGLGKFSSVLGLILMTATALAHGETWVAKCNGLEFRFDRAAKRATVAMQAIGGAVSYEILSGPIVLDKNGFSLRASISPPPIDEDDPIKEIGINKSRNIVYLYRLNNNRATGAKDGVFCETPVTVNP